MLDTPTAASVRAAAAVFGSRYDDLTQCVFECASRCPVLYALVDALSRTLLRVVLVRVSERGPRRSCGCLHCTCRRDARAAPSTVRVGKHTLQAAALRQVLRFARQLRAGLVNGGPG